MSRFRKQIPFGICPAGGFLFIMALAIHSFPLTISWRFAAHRRCGALSFFYSERLAIILFSSTKFSCLKRKTLRYFLFSRHFKQWILSHRIDRGCQIRDLIRLKILIVKSLVQIQIKSARFEVSASANNNAN